MFTPIWRTRLVQGWYKVKRLQIKECQELALG